MTHHLPECPAPLCDAGAPNAECMGYEECHHLCCCDALRACEHRVRLHAALSWEQGFEEGRTAGLDAAREAVRHALGPMDTDDPGQRDAALAAIDDLRGDR